MEYFLGSLLYLFFWFVCFFSRKDLRKKQIYSSLLFTPFGVLGDILVIPWYWEPQTLLGSALSIESAVFAFSVGGISSVLYSILLSRKTPHASLPKSTSQKQFLILTAFLLFWIYFFDQIINVSFIYNTIYTSFLGAVLIAVLRRDLCISMLVTSVLFAIFHGVLLLLIESFLSPGWLERTWNQEHLWGIHVMGIPLEEILWAWTFGLIWSVIYEFIEGYHPERKVGF